MAEEDDDESFGHFTFASSTNPSFNFHQQTSLTNVLNSTIITATVSKSNEEQDEDDEWGDFIKSPLESVVSPIDPSKTLDPLNFYYPNPASQSQSQSQLASTTRDESGPSGGESEKRAAQWVKLKGAIPLSIFGDVEEEEKEEGEERSVLSVVGNLRDRSGKENNSNNNGSKSNAHLGAGTSSDIIASLYSQGHNINGSNFDTYRVNSTNKDSISERNGVDLDISSIAKTRDLDAVTNLDDQGHKVHVGNGFIVSSSGENSNLDVLNAQFTGKMDFSGSNQTLSADLNMVDTVINNQNQLNKAESRSSQSNSPVGEIDLIENKSSNVGGWNRDFDGNKSNLNAMDSDLQKLSLNASRVISSSDIISRDGEFGTGGGGGNEYDDDDNDVWEFKDAHSESKVSNGNEKAQSDMHKVSEANTYSREPKIGLNGSIDLFSMSNGSFDLFSKSNGISSSSLDVALEFNNKPNRAAQSGVGSETYLIYEQKNATSGLDPITAVASAESDEDFGEFAAAFAEAGPIQEGDLKANHVSNMELERTTSDGKFQAESRVPVSAPTSVPVSKIANSSNGAIDLFAVPNGPVDLFAIVNEFPSDSDKVDMRFDINPSAAPKNEVAPNDYGFQTSSRSEQAYSQDALDSHHVTGYGDDFQAFTAAFVENAQKQEGVETSGKNHKGALPLSIFGDEELETDDSLKIQGAFVHLPGSSKKNDSSPHSTISINDLISNLYSQAEQISSVDSTPKPVQNGSTLPNSMINSHTANDDEDSDCSSWEFKDAFSERGAQVGTSLDINGDSHQSSSTKLKLNNYLDFYSKLKDELCLFLKCHFESLKEAQNAGVSGDDANLATLFKEIQEACTEFGQNKSMAKEDLSRDHLQRDADLSELIQVLQEPEFHFLDSEYAIQRKLSLVQSDFRSVIELIIHAKTMLKILSFGSLEEQSAYVSIWSKMIHVCAEELQHGADIWRDSLEKNVQSEILADPQGKRFVLALSEIYRVAVVVGASAKLYKPWILSSSVESASIPTIVDKCHALWQSSGLEEALLNISVPETSEGDNSLPLLDSIRYTRGLEAGALQSNTFDQQEPVCRLSLLTSRVAPGMAMVVWDDEQCFVKLANLWANLISYNRPKLPTLHVS